MHIDQARDVGVVDELEDRNLALEDHPGRNDLTQLGARAEHRGGDDLDGSGLAGVDMVGELDAAWMT